MLAKNIKEISKLSLAAVGIVTLLVTGCSDRAALSPHLPPDAAAVDISTLHNRGHSMTDAVNKQDHPM